MVRCSSLHDVRRWRLVALMAKSKKPRKKYRGPRWNSLALMRPKELEDNIKDTFKRCEIIAHMKMGNGTMTEDDIQCLRDFINFATTLIGAGKAIDREKFYRLYDEEWRALQDAFHDYYGRFIRKGTNTPTGDELRAIRSGVAIAGQIVQDELDREMFWCIKCFLYMKDATRQKAGRITVDFEGIEKKIALYGRKGWGGDNGTQNKETE